MKQYVIVGDTQHHKGCLVYACLGGRDHAERILKRIMTDPDDMDKSILKKHTNLRIEELNTSDCWWLDSELVR